MNKYSVVLSVPERPFEKEFSDHAQPTCTRSFVRFLGFLRPTRASAVVVLKVLFYEIKGHGDRHTGID